MRQKLLWGGAMVAAMGVAAGFFTVDHAARHPGSVLARFGVAAFFAGLNPNPLSDVRCVVRSGESLEQSEGSGDRTFAANTATTFGTYMDTLEPIQVEVLPPATMEPPVFGDSEWRPMMLPLLPVFIDETPVWMPFADETLSEPSKPRIVLPLVSIFRSSGTTWFGWSWQGDFGLPQCEEQYTPDIGVQLIDPPVRGWWRQFGGKGG